MLRSSILSTPGKVKNDVSEMEEHRIKKELLNKLLIKYGWSPSALIVEKNGYYLMGHFVCKSIDELIRQLQN